MNITRFISNVFSKTSCNKPLGVQETIAKYIAKNPKAADKKPFCHQYWGETADLKSKRIYSGCVTYHGYLSGINHHLTTGINPQNLTKEFFSTGATPKEIIKVSDLEFKVIPKTTEKISAYRCIGEKPEFFEQDFARYSKSLQVKKGDVITMPEFAYASSDIDYASMYLNNKKGIMYQIEIPEGSRISIKGYGINNEIVFPRCSQFECLETEQQGEVLLVKLRYIKPVDYLG